MFLSPGFGRLVLAIFLLTVFPAAARSQDWIDRTSCTSLNLESVWFTNDRDGWAVGGPLLRTENGGNWTPVSEVGGYLHDLSFRGASLGLAVGDTGLILRTTNGGQSWHEVESQASGDLRTVVLGEGGMAYAAGDGIALRSTDDGESWAVVAAGDFRFFDAAAVGTDRAWIVGDGGVVITTIDGGESWTSQTSGTLQDLRGISFVTESRGWIAGAGSTLLHTEDGGTTWLPRNSGINASLTSVRFVGPTRGWVVGMGGAILRTEDAGLSWVTENSNTVDDLLGVFFLDEKHGWAVGTVCRTLARGSTVSVAGGIPSRLWIRAETNPGRAAVTVRYELPREAPVLLRVLDVRGRSIANLTEARLPAGRHEIEWPTGSNAPGLYLVVLHAGDASASAKIVLNR